MKKIFLILFLALTAIPMTVASSLAYLEHMDSVSKDDGAILGWATGYVNYTRGDGVSLTEFHDANNALGAAEGTSYEVVCLGDGGQITLTFDTPIANGEGADFAVFENGFDENYLELAYVEVSSNGVDFVRFTNYSVNDMTQAQGGYVDPDGIFGLASEYMQGLGTLFDLDHLLSEQHSIVEGDPAVLDMDSITYVRIVDIPGDGSSFDSFGNPIYDESPGFGFTNGFDLDGIAVLNQGAASVPVPGAAWLMASGLACLTGIRRKRS